MQSVLLSSYFFTRNLVFVATHFKTSLLAPENETVPFGPIVSLLYGGDYIKLTEEILFLFVILQKVFKRRIRNLVIL